MSDEKLDRFARGELTAPEERELARKALEDPELLEELNYTAVARAGLANLPRKKVRWPQIVAMAAAAAILVGVALLAPRKPQPAAWPILLAGADHGDAVTFRGGEADSRQPRTGGAIGSLDGGEATIDLGSLDGLAKGDELEVVRDGQRTGKIRLTTLFRDRARGAVMGAAIRVNDGVRVPAEAAMRVALDRMDAALAHGDAESARQIARAAPVDGFEAGWTSAQDWNNAGAVAELHGEHAKAGELYRRALTSNPSGRERDAIEKNLARVEGEK